MNKNAKNSKFPKESFLSIDLVFCEVMRQKDICQHFLESLLHIQVDTLLYPDKQKDLSDAIKAHGARLDVFVKDVRGNAYNIEMQNSPVECLEKRARFYTAAIDRNMLKKREDYAALQNTIVIFVCNYDAFGEGLAEYTVEKTLVGPGTNVRQPYEDGARIYYLNAQYQVKNVNAEISDFLDLIRGEEAATAFGKHVTSRIEEVLQDDETRRQIMTMNMRLHDERWRGKQEGLLEGKQEGLQQGLQQGLQEGKLLAEAQMAQKLLALGWEKEKIAALLDVSPEHLEELLAVKVEPTGANG